MKAQTRTTLLIALGDRLHDLAGLLATMDAISSVAPTAQRSAMYQRSEAREVLAAVEDLFGLDERRLAQRTFQRVLARKKAAA